MSRNTLTNCAACGVAFVAYNKHHVYCANCSRERVLEKQRARNAEKHSTTIYIYGLYDPDTDTLCYVGKTNNPSGRLSQHIRKAHSRRLQSWIAGLARQAKEPTMRILEEATEDNWRKREQAWINTIIASPHRLNRSSVLPLLRLFRKSKT